MMNAGVLPAVLSAFRRRAKVPCPCHLCTGPRAPAPVHCRPCTGLSPGPSQIPRPPPLLQVVVPDEVTEPSAAVLFGYTDFELACLHVSLIVLLLVAGFLLGMPATTIKKPEFKAAKAEHPAGWWPLVDSWCRSVEWAQRTLMYEIGPPLVKAKFVIDTMKGLTPLVFTALMVQHDNWSVGAYTCLLSDAELQAEP